MPWTLRIIPVLLVLLLAYFVWPFVDLYRIGRAIDRRDAQDLYQRVDLGKLRSSISRQALATYLGGKQTRLSSLERSFIAGASAALGGSALDDIINAQYLIDLFDQNLAPVRTQGGAEAGQIAPPDLGSLWTLFADADYKLTDFYVSVPPKAAPADQFRLRLRLSRWRWRLQDAQLPESARVRLARELFSNADKR
jgi:hypothetical protein